MLDSLGSGTDLEQILTLSLLDPNQDRFLGLFYESTPLKIKKNTSIHLHVLQIENGDFIVERLFTQLANNSLSYVLTRRSLEILKNDPSRMVEFVNKVQTQFRAPDARAGEGGELILYSFLEGHLRAPKLLSKMDLKTSPNHYVYGSDGIHLLQEADGRFQVIYGESKMYGDTAGKIGSSIRRGIEAAFESVSEVRDNGFGFEEWLVDSNLLKEIADQEKLDALVSILLPTPSGSAVQKSNAFGIFVGFEIDVTSFPFADLDHSEIESRLRHLALDAIEGEKSTIENEIQHRDLGGYPLHVYLVPFLKRRVNGEIRGIENIRRDLAYRLSRKTSKHA